MKEIFSDVAAQKDLLGRDEFAKDIAFTLLNSLPNNSESIVLGLNGRWGSGKSTLLNLIVNALKEGNKENERMIIYNDFNPWMFSGQEALQKEFLTGLRGKLENNGKLKKYFQSIAEKAKAVTDVVPDKIDFGSIIDKLPDMIKDFIPGTELKIPYKENLSKVLESIIQEKSVGRLKKVVDALIEKENIKLFIFIDDLDRLTPDEIIQIFQLVKLNANFKNTVFIIAYDADIVQMALEKHYGENGKRYLGKIVQVDYAIPEMTVDEMGNVYFRHLKDFVDTYSINYNPNNFIRVWDDENFKNYFTTLRDVYRYFNGLLFRLPKIKDEINVEHFLILEAIRIFDFSSYQNIYLICKENLNNIGNIDPFKSDYKKEFNYKNPTSSNLISFLFGVTSNESNSRKAIGNRMYFENYFSLKVTGDNITNKEFQDFMTISQRRDGVISSVIGHGRLEAFLRQLTNSDIHQTYKIHEEHIFSSIIEGFKGKSQLLEEYSYQLFHALMNLAHNFENRIDGYQKLIDLICHDSRSFIAGKYWILHRFYLDLREPENIREQVEYWETLVKNKKKITDFLDATFNSWDSFPFQYDVTNEHRFIKKHFIQDFARFSPEKYLIKLDNVFKNIRMEFPVLLLILETMLLFNSKSKKPIRIDVTVSLILIPSGGCEEQFVEMLRKIESEFPDFLDKNNKANIAFFFNNYVPIEER